MASYYIRTQEKSIRDAFIVGKWADYVQHIIH